MKENTNQIIKQDKEIIKFVITVLKSDISKELKEDVVAFFFKPKITGESIKYNPRKPYNP